MSELEGYVIRATDGPIGHVTDFYFDDKSWVVRYLIIDTGSWLSSRKVLISPIVVGQSNPADRVLPASVTREQVKNSPGIDTDKPVSRQHEMEYLGYYCYPYYWGGAGFWGAGVYPNAMLMGVGFAGSDAAHRTEQAAQARAVREANRHQDDDPHLRSGQAVLRYDIKASDGDIGHVQGLLIDEETWAIRYLIVNTSNWWLGHQVLIAPQWIKNISWPEHSVLVNLTREAVRNAPPYDPAIKFNRDQEIGLHKHYERTGYWADEVKLENPQFRLVESASSGATHKSG